MGKTFRRKPTTSKTRAKHNDAWVEHNTTDNVPAARKASRSRRNKRKQD